MEVPRLYHWQLLQVTGGDMGAAEQLTPGERRLLMARMGCPNAFVGVAEPSLGELCAGGVSGDRCL